ncbi:hypothetical protein RISK_004114 [Rhodopirellula islandica]|uniref:DUF5722 domain-containing protein n=1 Tax=Rhodopirellula islandica TaxID=595434 RepID=A0A0J1BAI2_RHOIS|nr:DUF5722 domain-containing protein [Rhodopirellula islandica]KLU03707.1 hypothetical protein RISK_004114 [Rhodopirellula islandica]
MNLFSDWFALRRTCFTPSARDVLPVLAILALIPLFNSLATAQSPSTIAPRSIQLSSEQTQLKHLKMEPAEDAIAFRTTGNDPFIAFQIPPTPANERRWILAMEVFCPQGIRNMQLFYGQPWTEKRRVDLPHLNRAEGWTTYTCDLSLGQQFLREDQPLWLRLDFGTEANKRFRIRNVVLRLENDFERRQNQEQQERVKRLERLDEQIASYYQTQFPLEITRVEHTADAILVAGKAVGQLSTANLSLIARGLTEISAVPAKVNSKTFFRPVRIDADGTFIVRIPADQESKLRDTGVRWQVVSISSQLDPEGNRSATPFSAVHHVDRYDAAEAKELSPTPKLRAAKGMTCLAELAPEHVEELGLAHGSVNLVLSHLVSPTPRRGFQATQVRGRERYVNQAAMRHLDHRVQKGRDAGLVMAAILLIPNSRTKSTDDLPSLEHPNADPAGTYTMPNLVDEASAQLYADTLDFLAERYSEGNLRIDHWIVHNEIDAGWQWTNMGEVPMHVYLDHYFRSMRMVDAATRRVNPHARTFISLTHHWNLEDPPHWRWYASKDIMQALVRHGEVEGNFPWGLAHHPYPESLWESDTWNDNVEFTLDASMFTLKNWQVLDDWLHTERLRDPEGKVRAVLLSEQGFHASETDPQALEQQAAAVFYTFEQIRKCKSILAFDYHRPVDSRAEGGLHLGLRGLGSPEQPRGAPKPAWDAYKSIGTSTESNLRTHYESHWKQ